MKLTNEQRVSLEKSTARYEKAVDLAAAYLVGRGLSEETAHSFRLGVVDDPLPGDEHFRDRLSIPYLTRSGVVSLRYRCLRDHACGAVDCAKYLGYPGASTHLFNVGALFDQSDLVCITEGEIDAVVLQQGGLPGVGVPGGSNWKPHYVRIFEDYPRVFIFADGDDAGRKFGRRVAEALGGVATVVVMPDGMDVNEAYLDTRYGIDWLRSRTEG